MPIQVVNIIEEGRLGGPQIRIAEVAKALKPMGVETTVVFPSLNSKRFQKRLDDYQIPSVQMPIHRLTKDRKALMAYFFFFLYELILLYAFLRRRKFDVVHVSGGVWQFKGVIAGKLAGCRVVWHLNDTNTPIVFRYFLKFLSRWFVDGLIVAGKRVRRYYVDEFGITGKPVFEIQAPVDTKVFSPSALNNTETMLIRTGMNIVSVGNINPAKGYEWFIRMAAELNNEPGLNFYIIGPHLGSQKEYSRMLLNLQQELGVERLTFYGYSENIRDILKETDIYVCASVNEASPLSVWEAMSMGKTIVSTDVGDVSCLVKDGESGFIVPCRRPGELAGRVRTLIHDENLRRQFSGRVRENAIRKLDVKRIAGLHRSAYEKITGLRGS